MSTASRLAIFYVGTFLSSIGSLLLVMAIPAFFMANGIAASAIAVTIGIHRFAGIAATVWFGPASDHFNAKKMIILTEAVATLTTVGLWLGWQMRQSHGLYIFAFAIAIRAIALGAQTASRNRLIKLMSNNDINREATAVIWLTKATQGAHVVSALVALGMLTFGSLGAAILFDGITFLLSGISVWLLPVLTKPVNKPQKMNLISAFNNLVRSYRYLVLFDGLLALAVSGSILLMVKLSENNSHHLIYFNLVFGVCIWVSSLIAHKPFLRQFTIPYWLLLVVGFSGLSLVTANLQLKLVFFFIVYMGYWILYHIYTVELQTKSSSENIGGIMAARTVFIALILSLGELFGSTLSKFMDIKEELILRAGIAILAVVFLYNIRKALKPV